jgi:hypothetical protein
MVDTTIVCLIMKVSILSFMHFSKNPIMEVKKNLIANHDPDYIYHMNLLATKFNIDYSIQANEIMTKR